LLGFVPQPNLRECPTGIAVLLDYGTLFLCILSFRTLKNIHDDKALASFTGAGSLVAN
jgi:hypothetical protein